MSELFDFIRDVHEPAMQKCIVRIKELEAIVESYKEQSRRWNGGERIKELEAEREVHDLAIRTCAARIAELVNERDAIEAKTVEKCIEIGKEIEKEWREDAMGRAFKNEWRDANTSNAHADGAQEVVEAIRALAKPNADTASIPSPPSR